MAKRKNTHVKNRHKILYKLLMPLVAFITHMRYGIDVEPCRDGRQMLILFNHQTAFDQFFVVMAFWRVLYFVATEDIMSIGLISRVLHWLVAPIPIRKQVTDLKAVRNILKVAKEGGSIAMAPEGHRTYDGKTCSIGIAVAKLAKTLKLPVALMRIEGGYGVHPRWSDSVRKGKIKAYVSKIIEAEDVQAFFEADLHKIICDELYVNEANAVPASGEAEVPVFTGSKLAEYLERAVYYCPECGLSAFKSSGDIISCLSCGQRIRYLPSKELEGVGKPFPYRFVADWMEAQNKFVAALDPENMTDESVFTDAGVKFSEVKLYDRKIILAKNIELRLFGDRIEISGAALESGKQKMIFSFDELSAVTLLGKNKLNIYTQEKVYQCKGAASFNALKYVNFYSHYLNRKKGVSGDDEFLGL